MTNGDGDDHGVRRADTARAHARWWRIVALHEATDTLHRAMKIVDDAAATEEQGTVTRDRNVEAAASSSNGLNGLFLEEGGDAFFKCPTLVA